MICEIAPAKINLTLEIINKRTDGYHELNSIMQTIDLCDLLTFWENDWIQVIPEYFNLPSDDNLSEFDGNNYLNNNLVYRAASLLKEETGYGSGALIQLRKNIPSAAGLGGGSSDAAATLRGLNKLWKLGLSRDELSKIGSKIGSDVSYFIYGGTCFVKGKGEIVIPLKALPTKWLIVILIPLNIRQKTEKLYSFINPSHYSNGDSTRFILEKIDDWGNNNNNNRAGSSPRMNINDYLVNVFEIVYNNKIREFEEWQKYFERMKINPLHLAGSGPAVYYISDSEVDVKRIVDNNLAKFNNLRKYIARTVP